MTINCSTGGFGTCTPGTTSFGIAVQGFTELLPGTGYTLVGDKPQHPSNHWGDPVFVQDVSIVAAKCIEEYPGDILRYNDISLGMGGVFDVKTVNDPGYDWTPPRSSHRFGKNMDLKFHTTRERRNFLERLYRSKGI